MPINNRKKLAESIRSFEQAIRLNPMNRDAWYHRAKVFQHVGKTNECLISLDNSMKTDKNEFEDTRYKEILELCNTVLRKNNRDTNALRTKVNTLIKLEEYSKAYVLIDKILELKPDDYSTLTLASLAMYFKKDAEFETQISYVNKALRIKDDYPFAWYVKGLILHSRKYYSEAIDCYNNAVGINVNYTDAIEKRLMAIQAIEEKITMYSDEEIEEDFISPMSREEFT